MVAAVVVDQPLGNGVIALVRSTDGGVLGHVRALDGGAWHGAPTGEPARTFRTRSAAERYILSAPPSAWTRALERAIAEGIDPIEVVGLPGTFFCESASGGKGYLTDERICSCPAGDKGMACKHVAAVRACLGLPVDPGNDPRPEPPAGACPECFGSGWSGDEDSGPLACPYCNGSPVRGNNICRPCMGSGRRDRLTPAALAAWEEVQARRPAA